MNSLERRNALIDQIANAKSQGMCNTTIRELAFKLAFQCTKVDYELRRMEEDLKADKECCERDL